MRKRGKRYAAFITASALLIAVIPVSRASAYTAEGSYNRISYVARADANPGNAYMKISSSKALTHSGVITGKKQAFLGFPCGHFYEEKMDPRTTTAHIATYYVDVEHTIFDANFIWYIEGRNIESYGMLVKPYRAK